MRKTGFTLIELLVVVGILAVLALIALPNLLHAQTRSHISRVKADFRTIALALETYATDHGQHPHPLRQYKCSLSTVHELSTPVAYLATTRLLDVFEPTWEDLTPPPPPGWGYVPTYLYDNYAGESWELLAKPFGLAPFPGFGLTSNGPDRILSGASPLPWWLEKNESSLGAFVDLLYDPTNGTISPGDIVRWTGKPDKYNNN